MCDHKYTDEELRIGSLECTLMELEKTAFTNAGVLFDCIERMGKALEGPDPDEMTLRRVKNILELVRVSMSQMGIDALEAVHEEI